MAAIPKIVIAYHLKNMFFENSAVTLIESFHLKNCSVKLVYVYTRQGRYFINAMEKLGQDPSVPKFLLSIWFG